MPVNKQKLTSDLTQLKSTVDLAVKQLQATQRAHNNALGYMRDIVALLNDSGERMAASHLESKVNEMQSKKGDYFNEIQLAKRAKQFATQKLRELG